MGNTVWGMEKFDIFKGINPMEMRELSKIVEKKFYKKGSIITDINNVSREVFVLLKGHVDIYSVNGIMLHRIGEEETFGELAMVQSVKRAAVAVASEDSWVLSLNIAHLETLAEEYPSIYTAINDNLFKSIGIKLARANKMIEVLKSELTKVLKEKKIRIIQTDQFADSPRRRACLEL